MLHDLFMDTGVDWGTTREGTAVQGRAMVVKVVPAFKAHLEMARNLSTTRHQVIYKSMSVTELNSAPCQRASFRSADPLCIAI